MPKLIVRGHSDDIVTLEGDFHDEQYPDTDGFMVLISDGTVLSGVYDNQGFWRFNRIREGTATGYDKFEAIDPDGREYSDVITLEGDDVTWAGIASHISKAR